MGQNSRKRYIGTGLADQQLPWSVGIFEISSFEFYLASSNLQNRRKWLFWFSQTFEIVFFFMLVDEELFLNSWNFTKSQIQQNLYKSPVSRFMVYLSFVNRLYHQNQGQESFCFSKIFPRDSWNTSDSFIKTERSI